MTTRTTLLTEALEITGARDEKSLRNIIWGLRIRQSCTRCLGSGRHSYNQMDGDRCFGCGGRGEVAAKITRATVATLRAQVAAGDLDTLRSHWRALRSARASLVPMLEAGAAVYAAIGAEYTAAGRTPDAAAFVASPLFRAQHLNNAIFWDTMHEIEYAVRVGRRTDFGACAREMSEALEALRYVAGAWAAFKATGR